MLKNSVLLKKKQNNIKVKDKKDIKNSKSKKRKLADDNPDKLNKTKSSKLTKKQLIKYITVLYKIVENEEKKKKSLFNSEKSPIFLLITCFKIPKVPLHQIRMTLPNSLVSANDDVALFVKDLKRGRRIDYENTVNHYQNILQQHQCTQIKTIIPMNQVKTEYRQFEMRRRLLNSYDYFLIDGRISGHMAHLLGKSFRVKRKMPTSIHIEKKDLKTEIDNALKKTSLQIHGNGDCSITQIGNCSMDAENVADNIMAVLKHLKKDFPGGWKNIRSLRIKTPLSLSIPIFISLKNKNKVEIPILPPKRPKAYEEVEGELSTFDSNVKVIVAPDGTVNVQKIDESSDENSNSEAEENENENEDTNIEETDESEDKAEEIEDKQNEGESEDENEEDSESDS